MLANFINCLRYAAVGVVRKGNGVSGQSASRHVPASGSFRWPAGAMDITRLRRPAEGR